MLISTWLGRDLGGLRQRRLADLFVADDATTNHLYHNNHDGTFTDDAMVGGIAMNSEGRHSAPWA